MILQLSLLLALARTGSIVPRSATGIIACAAGLSVALWALAAMRSSRLRVLPEPAHDAQLVRHGPYARIRHPMYLALVLVSLGWLSESPSKAGVALWFALILVLAGKARLEERLLLRKFPDYASYQRTTWRLLPWIY